MNPPYRDDRFGPPKSTCLHLLLLTGIVLQLPSRADETSISHPLVPGIRNAEVNNPNWSRTHHDKLATGFSPLVCGMKTAPVVWSTIQIPGQVQWLRVLERPTEGDALLVNDNALRLISSHGDEIWSRSPAGNLMYHGNLHGDRQSTLLLSAGPRLVEVDASSGKTLWTHEFQPSYVDLVVRVADILPDRPGLEAAIFLNHGEEGSVWSFPPGAPPELVWKCAVVDHGAFDERYDHHSSIELDLSNAEEPVIWNVRRYRCRGIDARTGKILSTLDYKIGGEPRRNYGLWALGTSGDGQPLAVVFGESVQLHTHAIRLHRSGQNELAWEHYYGEVYKDAPGVALEHLAVADLDGDGATEMAYSVRDPGEDYRSFVRVRDAATGNIEFELADHWGAMVAVPSQPNVPPVILAYSAPAGATPAQGNLEAYVVNGVWPTTKVESWQNAGLLRLQTSTQDPSFFIQEPNEAGGVRVRRYRWSDAGVDLVEDLDQEPFRNAHLQAVLRGADGEEVYALEGIDGQLTLANQEGKVAKQVSLAGSGVPRISATDLDGDHRAELLVSQPQQRLQVYSFSDSGKAVIRADYPSLAQWFEQGPVAYDLDVDGRPEILRVASAEDGSLLVSAERLGGAPLWQSKLDLTAKEVEGCQINPGQFLAANHSGVAISVTDGRLVREGTYLLDGWNGQVQWFKSKYRDGGTIMPYRSRGVPTAVDFDGDGTEEIGMDLLSYMAFLRGVDGSFAYILPTHNIRSENVVYGGHLYNTYCPIFEDPTAARPHWFVIAGFGPFGLMKPDPTEGLWLVDLGYDVPPKIGLVDVDRDGRMEVGYAAINDRKFVCRDLWTGEVEWDLELPSPSNSPTYSADVDGDGKGEFLTASYAIGTDENGNGKLLWQAAAAMGWGAIADFDGDGRGEIACPGTGHIVILHSAQ